MLSLGSRSITIIATTSSIVIAQLAFWVRTKRGKQRTALQKWLMDLVEAMHGRILGFNVSTAHVWAEQQHQLQLGIRSAKILKCIGPCRFVTGRQSACGYQPPARHPLGYGARWLSGIVAVYADGILSMASAAEVSAEDSEAGCVNVLRASGRSGITGVATDRSAGSPAASSGLRHPGTYLQGDGLIKYYRYKCRESQDT